MALELKDLGYEAAKIRALKGGFPRWRELAYPVTTI
jgi:hypothetical protein